MRKLLVLVQATALIATYPLTLACGLVNPISSSSTSSTSDAFQGVLRTLGKERVFTRNGPGTGFRDTGTYTVADGEVRVYSYAYDEYCDCWVQCDIAYQGKVRRLYTRLEDIDSDCFDLSGIPEEEPLGYKAKVTSVTKLLYGPGEEYDNYGNSFKSHKGATVYITAIEGDYAQVQWTTSKQSYRVWVPTSILDY